MKHTWYVTFEVTTDGTLLSFARHKFNDGLIVTAGTINPHLPRASIPSVDISAWLEERGQVDPDQ